MMLKNRMAIPFICHLREPFVMSNKIHNIYVTIVKVRRFAWKLHVPAEPETELIITALLREGL